MNRVVITGMGTINPAGKNVDEFYNNLLEGKNCLSKLVKGTFENCKINFAGEINDFSYDDVLTKKEFKRMDLFTAYALIATDEAIKHSKLDLNNIDKDRFSVVLGTGIGGFTTMETQFSRSFAKGSNKISPLFIPMTISNMAAGNVSMKYGANGSCKTLVTACASSNSAIGEAFRNIKHGYSDIFITGGTEASITPASIAGFQNLTALSTSTDINKASIPFDKERGGFVMGEGAGILILESYDHAIKRGAKIYAEITGYGSTCDANHITSPLESGEMASKSMSDALKESNASIDDVTYINAHGTGTYYNDIAETKAIKHLFKDKAKNINISSTKSMTGHLLGAAGAIEAIATVKALENDIAFPTINYNVKDDNCDLNYTPNKSVKVPMKYALSNSLGFGGHNEMLCFKKYVD